MGFGKIRIFFNLSIPFHLDKLSGWMLRYKASMVLTAKDFVINAILAFFGFLYFQ
jgi:hypothetical protein